MSVLMFLVGWTIIGTMMLVPLSFLLRGAESTSLTQQNGGISHKPVMFSQ